MARVCTMTVIWLAGCGATGEGAPALEQALAVPMPTLTAAAGFSVLSHATVSCADGRIDGNVGTMLAPPSGSVVNPNCPISTGLIEVGTRASTAGYSDFLAAFDALRVQPCSQLVTGSLGATALPPGTYCFAGDAVLTGPLTLDGPADGTWLFKVSGALVGNGLSVALLNGANACNVTWWVEGEATLTDSDFRGNLFSGGASGMTRGTFEGRAFAKSDVTVSGAELIACLGGVIGGGGAGTRAHCNQGVGNGAEGCDPGNSNHRHPSNDESGAGRGRGR